MIHSKFIHFPEKKKTSFFFRAEQCKKKMRYRGRPTQSPQATERGRLSLYRPQRETDPLGLHRLTPLYGTVRAPIFLQDEGWELLEGLGHPPRSYNYYFLFIWDLTGSRVNYFCHLGLLFLQAKWNSQGGAILYGLGLLPS